MNTLIALAAHDPWLTLMWLMVAVVAISRVAIRRVIILAIGETVGAW